MRKSAINFTCVLFHLIFALTGCLTSDKVNTYRLKGADYEDKYRYYSYTWYLDIAGNQNTKRFHFTLWNTELSAGENLLGESITLYTEPYDLKMDFYTGWAYEKIIINKMLFRTKNQTIDLRKKITVDGYGYKSPDFESSGVIYAPSWRGSDWLDLRYDNIDVIFKKNSSFTIEYDITIEREYFLEPTENYTFTVKFNRKNFTERACIVPYYLYILAHCCTLF